MEAPSLTELKTQMKTAESLSTVYHYFLDHFGENPVFMKQGEPYQSDFLMKIIAMIGGQLFHTEEIVINDFRLIHLPGQSFIHGGGFINGNLANVLYAEDLDVGVLAVPDPKNTVNINYVRFSPKSLRDMHQPSAN